MLFVKIFCARQKALASTRQPWLNVLVPDWHEPQLQEHQKWLTLPSQDGVHRGEPPLFMEAIQTGHEKPVDRVAARMLAKAPWWATYPEPAKFAVLQLPAVNSWEAYVDYTKAPPRPNDAAGSAIKDRRGEKLLWKSGKTAVVIGWADSKRQATPRNRVPHRPPWWKGAWNPAPKRHIEYDTEHAWYVVNDRCEIERLVWRTVRDRRFRTETEIKGGKAFPPDTRPSANSGTD